MLKFNLSLGLAILTAVALLGMQTPSVFASQGMILYQGHSLMLAPVTVTASMTDESGNEVIWETDETSEDTDE